MKKFVIVALFAAIVAAPAAAQPALTWFNSQSAFEAAAAGAGKIRKGIENYEATANTGIEGFVGPLDFGVANGPFPNGTQGLENLTTQSNVGDRDVVEHRQAPDFGLVAIGAAAGFGNPSHIVLGNFFADSTDLIFDSNLKTAIGGDVMDLLGDGRVNIRVYDTDNNFLGDMDVSGDTSGNFFTGVISSVPIGRVNLFGLDSANFSAQGMDNIQAWEVPEPASLGLFLLGGLAMLRRR